MKRIAIALLICMVSATAAFAAPRGHSTAYGKSLSQWMVQYMTWFLSESGADHDKNVTYMPLPGGDEVVWTTDETTGYWLGTGVTSVSMKTGDAFAMPMFVWYGERYQGYPDVPDDPWEIVPPHSITDAMVQVSMDGKTLVDSGTSDMTEYYWEFWFDNPVVYPEPSWYGSVAALWAKGIGFVHTPLSRGSHTMKLRVQSDYWGVIFDNTWHITVTK